MNPPAAPFLGPNAPRVVSRVGLAALALTLVNFAFALRDQLGSRNLHFSWVVMKAEDVALSTSPLFIASLAALVLGRFILPRGGPGLALLALLLGGGAIFFNLAMLLLMFAFSGPH